MLVVLKGSELRKGQINNEYVKEIEQEEKERCKDGEVENKNRQTKEKISHRQVIETTSNEHVKIKRQSRLQNKPSEHTNEAKGCSSVGKFQNEEKDEKRMKQVNGEIRQSTNKLPPEKKKIKVKSNIADEVSVQDKPAARKTESSDVYYELKSINFASQADCHAVNLNVTFVENSRANIPLHCLNSHGLNLYRSFQLKILNVRALRSRV